MADLDRPAGIGGSHVWVSSASLPRSGHRVARRARPGGRHRVRRHPQRRWQVLRLPRHEHRGGETHQLPQGQDLSGGREAHQLERQGTAGSGGSGQGLKGDQGPAGPADWNAIPNKPAGFADGVDNEGVTAVKIKTVTSGLVTVTAGDISDAYADCPAGFLAVGGGVPHRVATSWTLPTSSSGSRLSWMRTPGTWAGISRVAETSPSDAHASTACGPTPGGRHHRREEQQLRAEGTRAQAQVTPSRRRSSRARPARGGPLLESGVRGVPACSSTSRTRTTTAPTTALAWPAPSGSGCEWSSRLRSSGARRSPATTPSRR